MNDLTPMETEVIGGASIWKSLIPPIIELAFSAVRSGGVDYAGLAESQGTYYNTVGA